MKTILVIEDEPELRESLSDMLSFEGYNVISASDGLEGANMAREHLPDLILCDILMPKMDGYEVLATLKQELSTAMIPFIFLTALSDQKKIRAGMNKGADDYIVKPFLRRELLDAIQSRLDKNSMFKGYSDQNLEKLRKNIISFLPHELITPLNGIISFGEIIKDHATVLSTSELSEMGAFIFESGRRFYDLVQKYLLYVQIAVNKSTGYAQLLIADTAAMIGEFTNETAARYQRSEDLTLNLRNIPVYLSAEELQIIVKELTDNAFKFSVKGSPVLVMTSSV
jgi:two-component system, sensor histidine kinase and response regulator